MHRVLRKVVPWLPLLFLAMPISGQTILDGEFGAAKKPLQEPGRANRRITTQSAVASTPPSAGIFSTAAGAKARLKSDDAEEIPASSKRYPYHGVFDRAGEDGGSIVLAGKAKERVILITARTNITRDGQRVHLPQALKGERVSGSVVKNAEGQEVALTLRLKGL